MRNFTLKDPECPGRLSNQTAALATGSDRQYFSIALKKKRKCENYFEEQLLIYYYFYYYHKSFYSKLEFGTPETCMCFCKRVANAPFTYD